MVGDAMTQIGLGLDEVRAAIAARLVILSDADVRRVDRIVVALLDLQADRHVRTLADAIEEDPGDAYGAVDSAIGIVARTVSVCGTCLEAIECGDCGCTGTLPTVAR